MDPDKEISFQLPFIRAYKSGRVERLIVTHVVPASVDPATGVSSKDVVIHSQTGVSARLYLPRVAGGSADEEEKEKKRLPVLVYFHGGAFCMESAFSATYHAHLNLLVSRANVVAVSVNYRLAPEDPLPAAYDDCWATLEWAASHALGGGSGLEPWLVEHGDLDRIFMAGDSAGANIVHNVAMRAGGAGLGPGARIRGLVLVHPSFWNSDPAGWEADDPEKTASLWAFVCPSSSGLDDPWINPTAEGAPALAGLAGKRVLVCVAQKDFLCQRGRFYYEALKASGWKGKAELLESPDEGHVFHLFNPGCENALDLIGRVVNLFSGEHWP